MILNYLVFKNGTRPVIHDRFDSLFKKYFSQESIKRILDTYFISEEDFKLLIDLWVRFVNEETRNELFSMSSDNSKLTLGFFLLNAGIDFTEWYDKKFIDEVIPTFFMYYASLS